MLVMKRKDCKVSILVPVYNVATFIEKCARSLFEQTFADIEYVFVDDCSPDNSVEILQRVLEDYPNRKSCVKILRHEVNKGLSSARNTALKEASGDYVFFIDSDDFLESDTISLLFNKAKETSADIVLCDIKKVYNDKTEIDHVVLPQSKVEYLALTLMRQVHLSVWGKLYNHKLFANVSFVEGVTFAEDYATLPRLIYYAHGVAKVEKPLYNYVKYNETSCTARMKQKNVDDALIVRRELIKFFTSIPEAKEYADVLAKALLYFKLHMVKSCWQSKEFIKQIAELWGNEGYDYMSMLPLKDKIIMRLLEYRQYSLLSMCLRIGYHCFSK